MKFALYDNFAYPQVSFCPGGSVHNLKLEARRTCSRGRLGVGCPIWWAPRGATRRRPASQECFPQPWKRRTTKIPPKDDHSDLLSASLCGGNGVWGRSAARRTAARGWRRRRCWGKMYIRTSTLSLINDIVQTYGKFWLDIIGKEVKCIECFPWTQEMSIRQVSIICFWPSRIP